MFFPKELYLYMHDADRYSATTVRTRKFRNRKTTFKLVIALNSPININPIPAGVLENQNMLGGVNLTPPL